MNEVLPSLTKIPTFCTGRTAVPEVAPNNAIGLFTTLLPVGNVAPVAAIVKLPLPSDEIVAPPRSIVSAATNKVCHLLVVEPN